MRLDADKLEKLKQKHNVNRLWSWSQINCFHNSHFEYYLKYIKKVKEDRQDCIYTTTGGIAHNILEDYYTGKIQYEDMLPQFETGWTTAYDIAELKFDRNSEEHDKQLSEKYYEDLKLFFQQHTPIKHKTMIEQFVSIPVDDNLFQGYIDCCYKDDEGCLNIIDFKTSSIYKGEKANNECGQLVLYAMGIHQKGIPYNKIKIAWNFLKYCTVEYQQANGAIKERCVERVKFGESMKTNVSMWLKKAGYDVDLYTKAMIDTNDLSPLPDDIKAKYKVKDCYVYVDLTDKLIEKWQKYITDTIADIKFREKDYRQNKNVGIEEDACCRAFWDLPNEVEKNSYYYSTLCGYSANLLLPYKEYLEQLEAKKNGSVFDGVGSDADISEFIDIDKLFD